MAPTEPLTREQYRFAMMGRIEKMVAATPRDRAIQLLRRVYDREGLDIDDRPLSLGGLLVENSDALWEHCPFPLEPVAVDHLVHEPRTLRRLLERPMSLTTFLNIIYPPAPQRTDW